MSNIESVNLDTDPIVLSNIDNMKAVILFIIQKHTGLTIYDQLILFNSLSPVQLNYNDFRELRNRYYKEGNKNVDMVAHKLEYHVDTGMQISHMKNMDIVVSQINYYYRKWQEETRKENPSFGMLENLTDLLDTLIKLHGQLNLGLPVMVYLKKRLDEQTESNEIIKLGDLEALYAQMGIKVDITSVTTDPKAQNVQSNGRNLRYVGNDQDQHVQQTDSSDTKTGTPSLTEGEDGGTAEALF